jgi:hypothetical protein
MAGRAGRPIPAPVLVSEQLALGLTALGLVLAYGLVLYFIALAIARTLAGLIGSRRGETIVDEDTGVEYDADDEVVGLDTIETPSGVEMRSFSRRDSRVRMWLYGVLLPLAIYLHYRFWDQIAAGFEVAFQHAGQMVIAAFYG